MAEADKVLWSEGLFLRPQHFQQQDRHVEALVRAILAAAPLPAFGFREVSVDRALLETGRVAVVSARGVFPDGTPFAIPETMDPPEPVAILRDTPPGPVLLALPLESPGGATFDPAHAAPSGARFRGRIERLRDAVAGGAEPEEVELARPQALLLAPGRDPGGYATLPVAGVAGLRADGGVALAEGFLPPALAIAAAPEYASLLIETIAGLDRVAEAHGPVVLARAGRNVENLLALELANMARPRLAHLLAQNGCHPSDLFLELAGLAGRMATYGAGSRRMAELPAYEHLAPGPAFAALTDTLRSLILTLRYVEPKSRALEVRKHETNVWKVRLEPGLLAASRIVLRVGSDMSEEALRRIFVNQVTVGSPDEFPGLWRSRLRGIRLKPLHSQPREIPYDGDRLCLELDRGSEHFASLAEAPGFMIGVAGVLPAEPTLDCYAVRR